MPHRQKRGRAELTPSTQPRQVRKDLWSGRRVTLASRPPRGRPPAYAHICGCEFGGDAFRGLHRGSHAASRAGTSRFRWEYSGDVKPGPFTLRLIVPVFRCRARCREARGNAERRRSVVSTLLYPEWGEVGLPIPRWTSSRIPRWVHDLTAGASSELGKSLHSAGPYNLAATLLPKVVRRIMSLQFVEMAELRADIWPDESVAPETIQPPRRPGKPPVTSIRS